jgi:hypothetical protein
MNEANETYRAASAIAAFDAIQVAVARWSRDADVATIARCILGTLKYEPHTADTTVLRQALEGVIKHEVGRDARCFVQGHRLCD